MRVLKFFLFICICFSSLFCFAQYGTQFENRGFETWANFGSSANTNEPVHWHSGKSASGSYSGMLSQQIEPSTVVRPGAIGSISARLWPTIVSFLWVTVTANGNMTCGRMNAGSTSATGNNNYNYTQRDDARFNTPIDVVPDSLTVWVCFRSVSATQKARVRAMIHGNADFREVADGSFNPANMLVATASLSFTRTSQANGNYTWRRLSIPFVQNGSFNDPRYILCTVTTNEVPGEGSDADDLYVDDILLIYNPCIQLYALDKDRYELGEELTLNYSLEGSMSVENLNQAPNQVIVQLSNANGSFSSPVELGRITTNTSGSINVSIPTDIEEGDHYRIRLVTTNYPMVSENNGTDLTIFDSHVELAEANHNEPILNVEVYDLSGRLIMTISPESQVFEPFNITLTPGVYVARCRTSNGIIVKKFLKQ